jgi:hypothetical protein
MSDMIDEMRFNGGRDVLCNEKHETYGAQYKASLSAFLKGLMPSGQVTWMWING